MWEQVESQLWWEHCWKHLLCPALPALAAGGREGTAASTGTRQATLHTAWPFEMMR